jgi:hypothetical protein
MRANGVETALVDRGTLERLVGQVGGYSVSIYQPTRRDSPDSRTDSLQLRNRLREAEDQLRELGAPAPQIDPLLSPARRLAEDPALWRHPGEGLALFLRPGDQSLHRLPIPVEALTVVGERFHVGPLLPLLVKNGRFWVLALGENHVRLYDATRHSMREIDLLDIPRSLRDAVGYDTEDQSLQFHIAGHGGRGGHAVFHGHDDTAGDNKVELAEFFRIVDRGLHGLMGERDAPLVVAAVGYQIALFRDVSKYPHVLEAGVEGSPKAINPGDLHARAWQLVEPVFDRDRQAAMSRYEELAGTGRTSARLEEILPASLEGRVGTLFVAAGEHRWGAFDRTNGQISTSGDRRPGDRDLLEEVAAHSLLQGAEIYAMEKTEVPGGGQVAALLRY